MNAPPSASASSAVPVWVSQAAVRHAGDEWGPAVLRTPDLRPASIALPAFLTFVLSSVPEQFGSFHRRGLMPKRVKVTRESDSGRNLRFHDNFTGAA